MIILAGTGICYAKQVVDYLASLHPPEHGANLYLFIAVAPKLLLTAILAFLSIACWRNYNSYKHLQIVLRRFETAGKLLPIMTGNLKPEQVIQLHQQFLEGVLRSDDTGLMIQTKSPQPLTMPSIKGE